MEISNDNYFIDDSLEQLLTPLDEQSIDFHDTVTLLRVLGRYYELNEIQR